MTVNHSSVYQLNISNYIFILSFLPRFKYLYYTNKTGYKNHLSHLVKIGAIDSTGEPVHLGGVSTVVPGLYYVGLEGQLSFASATLRGSGPDAKFVIRKLERYLKLYK